MTLRCASTAFLFESVRALIRDGETGRASF
jgi:hypothetical protein